MKLRVIHALVFLLVATRAWAGFAYYSPISINSAQVPTTQTDFPVLVSVTDARFKTVANSGHVQNANGYDIRPYTDSSLSTAISGYELERYNATTGEVVMWVKVSSLSSSTTPFVLAYGDAGISTDGSSTATWSNSFLGVYHLKDGTTFSVADSAGSNNGTNHSATATTGQVDGGGGFVSASSQYVDCGTGMNTVSMTYSAWVKATSFPNAYNTAVGRSGSASNYVLLFVKSTGKLACFAYAVGDHSYDGTGTNTLVTGTWYHVAVTYLSAANPNGGLIGYVNGAADHALVAVNSIDLATVAARTDIGQDAFNAGRFWNGSIDEVRVSSVARSANWIATEYNNQFAPGTFETLGTEATVGTGISSFFNSD